MTNVDQGTLRKSTLPKGMSWEDVEIATKLNSHEINDLVRKGKFPPDIADGIWYEHEVHQWVFETQEYGFWTKPAEVPGDPLDDDKIF